MSSSGDGKEEILSLDDDHSASLLSPSQRHLTLLSKDHQSFSLSKEAAASSDLLKTMMEGDPDASEVQLFHIDSQVVRRVIDYMEYHRTTPPRQIEKPIASTSMADLVDTWDAHYVDCDQDTLFKLLLAANYLHVKSLIALCAAKFASLIKNKTPEQIKHQLGVRGDCTAQEEADIAREYKDLIG
jgi:S-phase kinase-associated protein 1